MLQNRLEAVEALLRVLKAAQPREVGEMAHLEGSYIYIYDILLSTCIL